jgi:hypothetical protein
MAMIRRAVALLLSNLSRMPLYRGVGNSQL